MDDVLEHCGTCRAFDNAPHVPNVGTPTAEAFNEKAHVDLLFLDDIIALHAMDTSSKNSLLLPDQTKNPQEVSAAPCGCWLGSFVPPKSNQMDAGGDWKHEIRPDLPAEHRIKLQFQGVGAHPW